MSAGGHAQWRFRRHARAQRDIGFPVAAECALPARAVPQRAGHRRLDHAEQDLAVLDQGDVDGELAVALDELARAVERVHHPQPPPDRKSTRLTSSPYCASRMPSSALKKTP